MTYNLFNEIRDPIKEDKSKVKTHPAFINGDKRHKHMLFNKYKKCKTHLKSLLSKKGRDGGGGGGIILCENEKKCLRSNYICE